jgi:dTDP-4-amino-4,6-dideoxygalactose transaminase
MQNKIWLSSPHMGENELKYVLEAFDSNWIAPLGPNVDGFEKDLVLYTGAKAVSVLSSGTAAIHLALILLGVKSGDEVLVSSFTFSASVNPIVYLGATPVLIDSEPETWNISPEVLEEAIKDRISKGKMPKALILVHLYGMPARIDVILEIADRNKIPVIEDAAEALGSTYNHKPLGTFGMMGVLSFNGNKIITTSGGGALISNNEDLIERSRFLATQARDDAPHYEHSEIGYNYRMSNVIAGIGRGQMTVINERVAVRRSNFIRYKNYFDGLISRGYQVEFQRELPDSFSNRWLTCIVVDPSKNKGITRETIRLALQDENIESRPLWKPMHIQPVFASAPYYGNGCSENLFNKGLCLSSGSNLTDKDYIRIFATLDMVFK